MWIKASLVAKDIPLGRSVHHALLDAMYTASRVLGKQESLLTGLPICGIRNTPPATDIRAVALHRRTNNRSLHIDFPILRKQRVCSEISMNRSHSLRMTSKISIALLLAVKASSVGFDLASQGVAVINTNYQWVTNDRR